MDIQSPAYLYMALIFQTLRFSIVTLNIELNVQNNKHQEIDPQMFMHQQKFN
jgi:hypothetical protein